MRESKIVKFKTFNITDSIFANKIRRSAHGQYRMFKSFIAYRFIFGRKKEIQYSVLHHRSPCCGLKGFLLVYLSAEFLFSAFDVNIGKSACAYAIKNSF